jgi:CDGSH-type Zn-finger protein
MATKITINNNGPIRVEGDDFVVQDAQGKVYGLGGRTVISLCRCGFSESKPFCDGNHNRKGFTSQCEALDLPESKPKL